MRCIKIYLVIFRNISKFKQAQFFIIFLCTVQFLSSFLDIKIKNIRILKVVKNIKIYYPIFSFNLLVLGTCLIVKDNLTPRFNICSSLNSSPHMFKFFITDFEITSVSFSAIECK